MLISYHLKEEHRCIKQSMWEHYEFTLFMNNYFSHFKSLHILKTSLLIPSFNPYSMFLMAKFKTTFAFELETGAW